MFNCKQALNRLIEEEVKEGRVSGASALILHGDREVYFHACGAADKEKGSPMKRDTIIRLFSMSKPITAAAVMILAERGEIDLKDPVSKYLPAFAEQTVWQEGELVPVWRENTLWDLLNMTSGIPYPDMGSQPGRQMDRIFRELIGRRERGERVTTQEYMEHIAKVPLCFQPGKKWMYGLSADILGAVVEKVSGTSYGEFLRRELFEPLEMPDTGFFVPQEKKGRFAQIYQWEDSLGGLIPFLGSHLGEYYEEDVAFESGGAGLVSTLDDYSHFASMLLHKGQYQGKRILGEKTVEFMTRNQLSDAQKVDYTWDSVLGCGYGCLMRVLTDQGGAMLNASVGEFGWDGWTGNYVTIDPKEDLVFLYFIQRAGMGMMPVVRRLRMAIYGGLEEL